MDMEPGGTAYALLYGLDQRLLTERPTRSAKSLLISWRECIPKSNFSKTRVSRHRGKRVALLGPYKLWRDAKTQAQ